MTDRTQTAAGVLIYLATLVAIVWQEMHGHTPDTIMLLAGPVVAALLVNGRTSRVAADQGAQLAKIEAQTNGILDQRIRDGVRDVIAPLTLTTARHAKDDPR